MVLLAILFLFVPDAALASSRFHDLPESPQLRAIDRMLSLQMVGLSEHLLALPPNESKMELARLAMARPEDWEGGAGQIAASGIYALVMKPEEIQDLGHDPHWVADMGGSERAARYQGNVAKLALHLRSHKHELSLYGLEIERRSARINPDIFFLNAERIQAHLDVIERLAAGESVATYPENAKLKQYEMPGRRHVPKKRGKP